MNIHPPPPINVQATAINKRGKIHGKIYAHIKMFLRSIWPPSRSPCSTTKLRRQLALSYDERKLFLYILKFPRSLYNLWDLHILILYHG